MKKTIILSSLLLGANVSGLQAEEISKVRSDAISESKNLLSKVFKSKDSLTGTFYFKNKTTGEWEPKKLQYYIKLSFYEISSKPSYDGTGSLDYEVVVEHLLESGETRPFDSTFYAKRIKNGKFKMFDCDSTSNCLEDHFNSLFYVFDSEMGEGLRFRDADKVFTGMQRDLYFQRIQ